MSVRSAAKPLLNRPEQILYGRLVRAFPGHVILAHVPLAQLAASDAPPDAAQSPRVIRGLADFVVCRSDFSALAVIEITSGEKGSAARRERRGRTDRLLHAAGIKVIRVSARDLPHEPALKILVAVMPMSSAAEQWLQRAS